VDKHEFTFTINAALLSGVVSVSAKKHGDSGIEFDFDISACDCAAAYAPRQSRRTNQDGRGWWEYDYARSEWRQAVGTTQGGMLWSDDKGKLVSRLKHEITGIFS
jgi:hypothetical protein